jgi:hypothetical protein
MTGFVCTFAEGKAQELSLRDHHIQRPKNLLSGLCQKKKCLVFVCWADGEVKLTQTADHWSC